MSSSAAGFIVVPVNIHNYNFIFYYTTGYPAMFFLLNNYFRIVCNSLNLLRTSARLGKNVCCSPGAFEAFVCAPYHLHMSSSCFPPAFFFFFFDNHDFTESLTLCPDNPTCAYSYRTVYRNNIYKVHVSPTIRYHVIVFYTIALFNCFDKVSDVTKHPVCNTLY